MKTKKLYTVEELKRMGTDIDVSTVMEGQLTIFKPREEEIQEIDNKPIEGQITLSSLLPNNPRKKAHKQLAYAYCAKKRNR